MNKQEIYKFLDDKHIWHEITEHEAVFSMKEMTDVEFPHKEFDAKNLFLRDDKKRNYYLVTVKGNKRVDIKEFSKNHNTRRLSFASDEDLKEKLGITLGSVSPFCLLNNDDTQVKYFLDDEYKNAELIGIHPNDNTATIWMKVNDLVDIIKEHGNEMEFTKI